MMFFYTDILFFSPEFMAAQGIVGFLCLLLVPSSLLPPNPHIDAPYPLSSDLTPAHPAPHPRAGFCNIFSNGEAHWISLTPL